MQDEILDLGELKLNQRTGRISVPPEGYSVGPVTTIELLRRLTEGTVWDKELDVLEKLSSGKDLMNAVMEQKLPYVTLAVASLVVSLAVASLMFSSIFSSSRGRRGGKPSSSSSASSSSSSSSASASASASGEEEEPPRDFTTTQLREFDGEGDKPIYVSLRGVVYDVSSARDFYGKGSGYHCFAGREASRAMAKLSFEESELSSTRLDDLNAMELDCLDNWIDKFKNYKCYPVRGRCSEPPAVRVFKRSELAAFKGDAKNSPPEGRVDAPILLGINGKVLDVSYGGKENYGAGGPYCILTGTDATRALAKMSFDPSDISSHDTSDLTDKQREALQQWETRLTKKYPIVGNLD
jgi:membrane-associated progesterone receptor component